MAAFSPPLLIPILVILLATAATTQCYADKHHGHAAKAAFAPPATVQAICHTTPHPASCLASAAVHLDAAHIAASSVAVTLLPPNILSVALTSLRGSLTAVSSLSPVLSSTLSAPPSPSSTPLRRGAAQDCLELHDATLESLSRSTSLLTRPGESLPAVRAHLSAALTNKATCLDGLAGASGPRMDGLLSSLDDAYEHVSNSLSLVARRGVGGPASSSFQATVAKIIQHNRRLLQDDSDDYNGGGEDDNSGNDKDHNGNENIIGKTVITVAKDGTGNFRTVGEAMAAAPSWSNARTVIKVKAGTYEENVEVPLYKTNIALVGEGRDVTVITSSRSAADGWTTFRTATVGNHKLSHTVTY
ncbi:hypothetical protein ACQ4PT_030670 [Festuca glaucescens]